MAIAEAAHSISTSCTFLTQTLGNDLRDLKTGELCSKMRHQARVDAQISLTSTLYVNADFVLKSLFLDPELAKRFCDQRDDVVQCDSVALRDHFNTTKGRKENPEFGCHGHHLGNSEPSRFDSFLGLSVDNRSRTLG